MKLEKMDQIFRDTAFVHAGGSDEELQVAKYFQNECAQLGLEAAIEPFEVQMANVLEAKLYIDGKEIPCKGYKNSGSGEVEAEIYYLRNVEDAYSLKQCKGKIVLIDTIIRHWSFQDIYAQGAVGFITFDGNVNFADRDIDQKELRAVVGAGKKLLGVNINAKDAVEIIRNDGRMAKIVIEQEEYVGESRNVVLDLPGEIDEYIVMTAHYDSVPLAHGAYDNMSGSVALLAAAEYFKEHPHRYGLRFVWCGSEERGLLGAKAYCKDHADELAKIVLCVNIDMIGPVMGGFHAVCTTEDKLVSYIEYMANEVGFPLAARPGVYSSDSTPFADNGVPAVSFARLAPGNTAAGHCRYDTLEVLKMQQLSDDIDFIRCFTERMANAKQMPVGREIPEKLKQELAEYLLRKRPGRK